MTEMSLVWIEDYTQTGLSEGKMMAVFEEKCQALSRQEVDDFYTMFGDDNDTESVYTLMESYDVYLDSSANVADLAAQCEEDPALSWGRKEITKRIIKSWHELLDSNERAYVEIRGVSYFMTGGVNWGGGIETDAVGHIEMLNWLMGRFSAEKNMENVLVLSIDAHLPASVLELEATEAYTVIKISPKEIMFVLSRCGLRNENRWFSQEERNAGWPDELVAVRNYAHGLMCKYIHFKEDGPVINEILPPGSTACCPKNEPQAHW